MTNMQLYFAIGIPALISMMNTGILILYINHRLSDLKELWRAELKRVEEVLDARLKHVEEKLGIGG